MKLTDWFPASTQPVREGWYMVDTKDGDLAMMYFSGTRWYSRYNYDPYADQGWIWRGVANEP